ncbi:MAG TPA: protein kinase, partial [Blastocatellia bacterium]|nr:protein kinase [Blastocatellia bacterium]
MASARECDAQLMLLPINTIISHYRILSRIGAGGMGDVYLAEDANLGRRVALKILPEQFNEDEDRLRRFEQEARAASALNHPNIITIHEVGRDAGMRFIATEFIEGETVRQILKRDGMNIRQAVDIAIQVARALAAAHRAGIVHRDIKPENVMLRPDGLVKVLDFGVVKLTEVFTERKTESQDPDDGDVATLGVVTTEANIVMGSPNYMSPEQARGFSVDSRTDIFSFGALLYEMLTGKMAFKGESVSDVLVAILERRPPSLSESASDVPPQLQSIVDRSLAKDLASRYQTASDLIDDLKQLRRRIDAESGQENSWRPVNSEGSVADTNQQSRQTADEPSSRVDHVSTVPATSSAEFIVTEIKTHKRAFVSGVLFVMVAVGSIIYFTRAAGARPIDSIAVLPFSNTSADPNTEYLSDGLTESLINNLSQSHKLKVMSRNSVFRYKGRDADPKAIGRELGVHGVLSGRIIQRADTISISVDLIDARDDSQVWGEQYNRPMSDLAALPEEIARQVSEKLQHRLSGEDEKRVTRRHTENADAYQLYLKGRFYWNKRTEEGLNKGVEYFNQAIEKDPAFALAYAGLADCYALLYEYSATPSKDLYPKAKAAAMRALDIDDSLAEAHTSLAAAYEYEWNWSEAEKQYERAIELNENYATAHQWYSAYLISRRRFDEAIREARRAAELDPLSLIINTALGRALQSSQRYDEAIDQIRKTIDMDPNFAEARFQLALAYEGKRAYNDAIREFEKFIELSGDKSMKAWVGREYAISGLRTQALRIGDEMMDR